MPQFHKPEVGKQKELQDCFAESGDDDLLWVSVAHNVSEYNGPSGSRIRQRLH
jgi:hypothetical protein